MNGQTHRVNLQSSVLSHMLTVASNVRVALERGRLVLLKRENTNHYLSRQKEKKKEDANKSIHKIGFVARDIRSLSCVEESPNHKSQQSQITTTTRVLPR